MNKKIILGIFGIFLLASALVAAMGFNQIKNDFTKIDYIPRLNSSGVSNPNFISTNYNGYDYMANNSIYTFYVKSNSNAGDGTEYCKNYEGIQYCLIYQASDVSYRDGTSQDYISSISSVTGNFNKSQGEYQSVFPSVNLIYTLDYNEVKETFSIDSPPNDSSGNPYPIINGQADPNATLDFGGYIKFPPLNIMVNGINKTGQDFNTTNEIDFVAPDGTTLFYLPKPLAYDSNGNVANLSYEVYNQGTKNKPNFYFYIQTPYKWLNSSVYPITIDPSIKTAQKLGAVNTSNYFYKNSQGVIRFTNG